MKRYLAAVAVVLIFMAGMMLFAQPLGAQKPALQKRTTHGEYIDKYKDLAIEDMEVYGIPASITMAQGLLESDCGNSRLAVEANNHFGIKCKSGWEGETIHHDDDAPGECFRSYASAAESCQENSVLLWMSFPVTAPSM